MCLWPNQLAARMRNCARKMTLFPRSDKFIHLQGFNFLPATSQSIRSITQLKHLLLSWKVKYKKISIGVWTHFFHLKSLRYLTAWRARETRWGEQIDEFQSGSRQLGRNRYIGLFTKRLQKRNEFCPRCRRRTANSYRCCQLTKQIHTDCMCIFCTQIV